MTTALTNIDLKKLEGYWINHKDNQSKLKFREWELLNPIVEDNETGIRSSAISKPTERNATRLADDKYYQNLKHIVHTIEDIYDKLDNDTKLIVDMRYWDKEGNCYEWEEIADKLFMSRHKVLRKRNVLIDLTAERIGWV